jgi:hypothetical protein
MTPTHRVPVDDAPRILPLRPQDATGLRSMLESIASDAVGAARGRGLGGVTISIDVAEEHVPNADREAVASLLRTLVNAAVESAAAPADGRECPPLHEVTVTSVDTGAAIEIEVADSGAAAARLAEVEPLAERCGGSLLVAACPEGGTAVTVRFPHRRGRSMAA